MWIGLVKVITSQIAGQLALLTRIPKWLYSKKFNRNLSVFSFNKFTYMCNVSII